MSEVLNQLKRQREEDSTNVFEPSSKRFKYKHLNDEIRSSCSISYLEESDTRGSVESGYSSELGASENAYYPQNQMLFNLHLEREMRKKLKIISRDNLNVQI
ncbi:uncharacterized protein LOC6727604 [Drosophila simulans]|uniref:uncharacterized protein LOC6727604 n=1 Tax=Drosophila simulans TaxID=7240 RepID=UPI00078AEB3D|nr:uncharacterized protein LOC6727604 [Drosophila simulans]KMZ02877.1 uncharacterized protein Dsimw501_GD19212 [Drosophila simulans]